MGWREEVDVALRSWLAAEGGGGASPTWRRIGGAVRGSTAGEFEVDVRGSKLSADQLQAESLRLGEPDRAIADQGHHVMDVSHDGSTVRVRVPEFVDLADPTLWLHQQPPTFLIDSLIRGIAGIADERLAGRLARGELGGTLAPIGTPADVLSPAQDAAYRACRGTGLWMVWGPPGTGKTSVILRAIVDLVADGKRVLLVSSTNIAVDNVVVRVAKEARDQPGTVVRIGTPHLREVGENGDVCLPLMVRVRLTEVDRERQEVAAELARIKDRTTKLAHLDAALVGFDKSAFDLAERRLADGSFSEVTLAESSAIVETELEGAAAAVLAAETAAATAESESRRHEKDRENWYAVDALTFDVNQVEMRKAEEGVAVIHAQRRVSDAKRRVSEIEMMSKWQRVREPGTPMKSAKKELALALEELAAEELRRDQVVTVLDRQLDNLGRGITDRKAQISVARKTIDQAEALVRATGRQLAEARAEQNRLATKLTRTKLELDKTRDAIALVGRARKKNYVALHYEAAQLRIIGAGDSQREPELRKRHDLVQEQYEALAKDAQGAIIREAAVVACTLAKFRTTPAAMAGPYDVVIVDEVGAASLPEVLLAVSAARQTAVLLGDFMQLGPIPPTVLEGSQRHDIQKWLLTEVYDHCRIDSAASAKRNPGCITLNVQHRFGPDVMHLANTVAYDNELAAGPSIAQRARSASSGDAEIVLIDTDGLADLGQIHLVGAKSGWWAAGMLLSRALAEMHAEDGATVGIVTPYSVQADATLEALRQAESSGAIVAEVGTAHRFQGREFGVVVFDLVESVDGPRMWMANASRAPGTGKWARSGLRLFNVAVTRVQERVYIVGSRHRVEAADPHAALGGLHAMLTGKRVRIIAATELIAPTATGKPLGPVGSKLAEVLSRHVEISDIQDEIEFYQTFTKQLQGARKSIWIWAPWVANRMRAILPSLTEAAQRGVRIVVFIRDPGDQLQQQHEELVADLAANVGTVVRVNVMHQKIIVIDEQTVMLGSLNPLSQSWTREIMVTMRGSHLAKKLLDAQHAETFARPPECPGCQRRDVDLRRRKNGIWYWRCWNRDCPSRNGTKAWTRDVSLPR
ncbi:AAA domain-containing protein [Nocardia sp. NPDC058666]|uniref:AAA domain-containing protein n=1 Tax=Nocardia sp. NPDC058666 TaxID=3346587 RepID=UPI00364D6E89